MEKNKFWERILGFTTILILSCGTAAKPIASIQGARVWPSPGAVRIVFDLDQAIDYKLYTLSNPNRVVVDFSNSQLIGRLDESAMAQNQLIEKMRTGRHDNNTRIVFETKQLTKPKSFVLTPNEHYGHRLVVDLEFSEKKSTLALSDHQKNKMPRLVRRKNFVIAIDAGHGGEDPGAIGPRGTQEKMVVLQVAKALQKIISREKNFRAFLVREGDYYIRLRDRMSKARKRDADLFISLHADAFKNPRAKGASIFVLSQRGASSEAARWLAESENRSDLMGGVRLDDKGDVLASVLLDLSQTANEVASLEAAEKILADLGKATLLHKAKVERAGFAVLKAPDIPSLLVEIGFISHPKTELKLRNKTHQQKIARSIFKGIKSYFHGKPLRVVGQLDSKAYTVVAGDTLGKIAKQFSVPLSKLRKANQLNKNTIQVGQVLMIPD